MKLDKACKYCGRTYRGEGHQDACTRDCYFKMDYSRRRGKKVLHAPPIEFKQNQKTSIEKANEKWLNRGELKKDDPKETRRKQALLESRHVRHSMWSGNQYGSCRG